MSDRINMTVKDLRDILKELPDDMDVIIPVVDEDDANYIVSFRHVRTAGILKHHYVPEPALCISTSADGVDMHTLIKLFNGDVTCEKVLF